MAYTKNVWNVGDTITKEKLDNIENGISNNDTAISSLGNATTSKAGLMSPTDKTKLDGIAEQANKYTLPAATKSALGGVKQVALVPDATGENVTKEEYNLLLAALKTAGIMADS